MDISAMALQPGLVPRHAEPKRGQRLLAAATGAAALLVGLNALVQALRRRPTMPESEWHDVADA